MSHIANTNIEASAYAFCNWKKTKQTLSNMNNSLDSLSAREKEVFILIAQGNKNKEIGKLLAIAEATVETHRKHIKKKLGAQHTTDLCRIAQENDLI